MNARERRNYGEAINRMLDAWTAAGLLGPVSSVPEAAVEAGERIEAVEYRLHQAERFLRALANATSPEDAPSWVEINRFLDGGTR